MTNYTILIFIIFAAVVYRSRHRFRLSRSRSFAYTGLGFCVMSLNLWGMARIDELTASVSGVRSTDVFATPWPWIAAFVVGISLLVVSFLTRNNSRNAA